MKRLITIALALLLTTLCMTGTADDVEMPSGIVVYDMGMRCYNAEEPDYAQAASYFLQAAEQGITQAMEMLADMYSEGRGVEKDANKAAFYYAQAAAQGADRSQYIIGTMFETGDLTIEDDSGTIQWDDGGTAAGAQMYTEDSAAAYYRMQYEAGMQEEENEAAAAAYYCLRYEENAQDPQPDYEQAANWYEKAAEQGNADALNSLGLLCAKGLGMEQSFAQAAVLYEQAARQGCANAMYNLGMSYYMGQGVEQDYTLAADWHGQAAEQGNVYAQFFIGNMYQNGLGVDKDIELAIMWYELAAGQGFTSAQEQLDRLLEQAD